MPQRGLDEALGLAVGLGRTAGAPIARRLDPDAKPLRRIGPIWSDKALVGRRTPVKLQGRGQFRVRAHGGRRLAQSRQQRVAMRLVHLADRT